MDLQGTQFLLVSNLQNYIPGEHQKILKFKSKSVLKKFIFNKYLLTWLAEKSNCF